MPRTRTAPTTDRSEVNERVAAKIKPASELEDYVRVLLYGRSGTRKTRTASTAPGVLLIDVNEKGTASVRRDYNPNVFPVEFWHEVTDVYWYLQSGDHPYVAYAMDGVTALQNLCMKFVLGDEAARDASRDPDMPTQQVYKKVGELMKTQITNFRNLPMNGIFTALDRTRSTGEDDLDAEEFTVPNCTPAVASALEAAVDIIGYLSKRRVVVKKKGEDGKIRRSTKIRVELLVGDSEKILTKERYGVLPSIIQAPSLATIFKTIEEA